MKSKTLATWLAFLGGPLGLHRFYLHGPGDWLGWLLPVPTALGLFGVERIRQLGVDDQLSWVLVPLLGLVIAACALTAIVYGLAPQEKWNARHNPGAPAEHPAGRTYWLTVFGVAAALLVGAAVLMATIAFGFEHFWQYQIEEARKISQ
ncbi:TM2 domain-containing protein [Comamonas flocculans]|uniref:TM2 domain-containing protein n=1 Tax=Comamonas flocculans TaxID=2597701 RepID=A0A5B8RRS4_9BURK|nr:TM2 domain-containing protein [Comamonas flocculans]QEA12329.1 TM2 domain-containing protein [Comamonas flocculans]